MAASPDEPFDALAPPAALAPDGAAARLVRAPADEALDQAARSRAVTKRSVVSPREDMRSPTLRALSPRSSREASPTRPNQLPASARGPPGRSRTNSHDASPHRPKPATKTPIQGNPSAAAVQRALSATGTPQLTPDASAEGPRTRPARKGQTTPPGQNNTADTSRIKSPTRAAPTTRAAAPPRKPNSSPPLEAEGDSSSAATLKSTEEAKDSEPRNDSGLRSPTRPSFGGSALESVQESTLPEAPAIGSVSSPSIGPTQSSSSDTKAINSQPKEIALKPAILSAESESESSSSKRVSPTDAQDENTKTSLAQALSAHAALRPKKSSSQMSTSSTKGKNADGSVRNMTVETVTVNSLPHLAVGNANADRSGNRTDTSGTLRVKPSTETIRPKKEKKKTARKAPSGAGAPSSKADIFEAKVASAVDEADSSDSGEEFMYESGKPEPPSRSSTRLHHSRTPSVTSTASQVDPHGRGRSDGHNSITGKKSMKFTNSLHNLSDYQASDSGQGPTSSATSGPHRGGPHHIGRHGRPAGHASILGNDTPFAGTPARLRNGHHQQRHSARNMVRDGQFLHAPASSKSQQKFSTWELDDEEAGADDERTPLMSTAARSYHGNRHSRRAGARYRPSSRGGRPGGFVHGVCGWMLLGALVAALIAAIVTALVLCSRPLRLVHIGEISNVIASEEEMVFDLRMFATNPNLVTIQVDELNMKVFAKSKYVGSTAKSSPKAAAHDAFHPWDNVDHGTDPIDDEPDGADTMLLSQIFRPDSPFSFAPSPFSQVQTSDLGEISFSRPGNRTADDGTERWKTVVQHPFELIVVGQLRYTLPISAKVHSVSVGRGRAHVEPRAPEPTPEPTPTPTPEPPPGRDNDTNGSRPIFMPGPVKAKVPLPVRLPLRAAPLAG